ncbi:glycosyltransferase family 4 protein [Chitinophaga sp. G-6-1-13]|uniref:Glycosyltransferase family 4 protein n=1 Tax=Chitinophaga fulva TaxID=2728842 RepID=A0A848GF42_9BACT|nr:glycosyltransferase family 1 protein [Chitinophaga fulva]NML37265.1 glycosyltransferase family 4 protein [Chitinophaga fulva]
MHRILIDINSCTLKRGQNYLPGIGRSTLELIRAFGRITPIDPIELQLYAQYVRSKLNAREDYRHLKLWHIPLPGNQRLRDLVCYTGIREYLSRYDLLHVPHNYETVRFPERTIVTIHDTFCFKDTDNANGLMEQREKQTWLAHACKAIVTCSEASKTDIIHNLNVPPEKIVMIPWGINTDTFFPEAGQNADYKLSAMGVKGPYFLSVSCGVGRKNTPMILHAYRYLYQQTATCAKLVLVWKDAPVWLLEEFAPEFSAGRILLLPAVDDQMLRSLYSAAIATLYLSRYEGFGFVPLESMACGTPVIIGSNTALKEVAREYGTYVDITDKKDIAAAMAAIMNEKVVFNSKVLHNHAAGFNWDITAKAYLNFYMEHV